MASPLIPFPIFPPYEHWYPSITTDVPENFHVRHRLDEIDPVCLPYRCRFQRLAHQRTKASLLPKFGEAGAATPTRRELRRAATTVKAFKAFYIAEIGGQKANCAQSLQRDFLDQLAMHRPLIEHNRQELDWAFEQIMGRHVAVLRAEQMLLYMAVARYSAIPIENLHR